MGNLGIRTTLYKIPLLGDMLFRMQLNARNSV